MARIKLLWERPSGNTDRGGTIVEGESFANYTSVFRRVSGNEDADISSALPVSLLRITPFWVLIDSDRTFSFPVDETNNTDQLWGFRSQVGVSRSTLASAELTYYRWIVGAPADLAATIAAPSGQADLDANWFSTEPAVPPIPTGQDAVLYTSTVTLEVGAFSTATAGIENRRIQARTYFRWIVHDTKVQVTPNTPTTDNFINWASSQPPTPVLDADQETRHLYTSNVVTFEGNQVIRATVVTRVTAQSKYAEAYYLRTTSTGTITTPDSPTSTTLSQWSRTAPPLPTLVSGQTSRLFKVFIIRNYDDDSFDSAGTVQIDSTVSPTLHYLWVTGAPPLTAPANPSTATFPQWSSTQPDIPALVPGLSTALYTSTITDVNGVVVAASAPVLTANSTYHRRFYYRQIQTVPPDITTANLGDWTTTTPADPIPDNTWRSNVFLRGTTVVNASTPENLNPTITRTYYQWSVSPQNPPPAPLTPTLSSLGDWALAIPADPTVPVGQFAQLYQSDITFVAGVFSVATAPTATSNQLITHRTYYRVVTGSPPIAPIAPTTATLGAWSQNQQTVTQLAAGSQAWFYEVDVLLKNTTVTSTSVLRQTRILNAATYYAWSTGTEPIPAAQVTNLTNYSSTEPAIPTLAADENAQLYTSVFILESGAFVSATTPALSGELVQARTRYLWVTLASKSIADPATPTSGTISTWAVTQPAAPALNEDQATRHLYTSVVTIQGTTFIRAATPVRVTVQSVYQQIYYRAVQGTTAPPAPTSTTLSQWSTTEPAGSPTGSVWQVLVLFVYADDVPVVPFTVTTPEQITTFAGVRNTAKDVKIHDRGTPLSNQASLVIQDYLALNNSNEFAMLGNSISDGSTVWFVTQMSNLSTRQIWLRAYTLATGARDTTKDVKIHDRGTPLPNQATSVDQSYIATNTSGEFAMLGNSISDGSTVWFVTQRNRLSSRQIWLRAYTLSTGARDTTKDVKIHDAGTPLPNQAAFVDQSYIGTNTSGEFAMLGNSISDGSTVWFVTQRNRLSSRQIWLRAYTLATGARDTTKDVKIHDAGTPLSNQAAFVIQDYLETQNNSNEFAMLGNSINDNSTVWFVTQINNFATRQIWLRAYTLATGARDTTKDVKIHDRGTPLPNQASLVIQDYLESQNNSNEFAMLGNLVFDNSTLRIVTQQNVFSSRQIWLRAYE